MILNMLVKIKSLKLTYSDVMIRKIRSCNTKRGRKISVVSCICKLCNGYICINKQNSEFFHLIHFDWICVGTLYHILMDVFFFFGF
jgi:hypothetical protein